MLKHISKRAGTRAATLAITVASLGCTAMGSAGPAATGCGAGESGTAHAAPSGFGLSSELQNLAVVDETIKPTSVEERHFDIYKRYRALSDAMGHMQVSGGVDGRGRGNAGMPDANGDLAKNCSIRDLKTSD